MGCETPEVSHPHFSHCEQDLPQREVGFLRSVNEDPDAVHDCYIQKQHITMLSSFKPEHKKHAPHPGVGLYCTATISIFKRTLMLLCNRIFATQNTNIRKIIDDCFVDI